MALRFLDYKVQAATFSLTPELAPNKNYQLSPKVSCNIRHGADKLICSFNVELVKTEGNPLPFEFSVKAFGTFSIGADDNPSALAVKAAESVYPFVRQSVASLTAMANIPAYMLPMIDMNELIVTKPNAATPTSLN